MNIANRDSDNALDHAVSHADLPMAQFLLERGAKVTAPTPKGEISLLPTIRRLTKLIDSSKPEELLDICCQVLNLLVAHGADVNESFPHHGFTPLHMVAGEGFSHRVMLPAKRLLEMGADLAAVGKDGRTPLHYARGHTRLVLLLDNYGY